MRQRGRPIKTRLDKYGYVTATLYHRDTVKYKVKTVHRLVAIAFIGDPCGLQVNHKNGVKTDNRVENLEWVTNSQNQLHRCRVLGQRGERAANAKLTEKQVPEIRAKSALGQAATTTGAEYGVTQGCILAILHGRTWSHVA